LSEVHLHWWLPFGRQRRISRYLLERLRPLLGSLFDAYALDPDREVAMESKTASDRIRGRIVELQIAFRRRYMAERASPRSGVSRFVRRVSREEAAHLHFERPEGLSYPLTRDIDAWRDPKDRIWSAEELARAQSEEARREAKQEQLRQINEKTRELM